MASPSQPVAIRSPRTFSNELSEGISASFTTPIGTPADLQVRALRAQYTGTPPILPNIPPRGSTPVRSGVGSLIPTSDAFPQRPSLQAVGGTSVLSKRHSDTSLESNSQTPPVVDLETLPDEEKAKVVRQLLSLPQERQTHGEAKSIAGSGLESPRRSNQTTPSRPSSSSARESPGEDREPFPIPYHAPGADVT